MPDQENENNPQQEPLAESEQQKKDADVAAEDDNAASQSEETDDQIQDSGAEETVAEDGSQNNITTISIKNRKVTVKPYDLKIKHNVIPERFPALEIVNERFSRQFRVVLFNRIRRNIDIIMGPIKKQTFAQFAQNTSGNHLNLVNLHPLRGASLFVFSPELVTDLVNNLFGGEGRFVFKTKEDREFTITEQQVVKRILQLMLSVYQSSWADVYPIETEYVRSEMQIRFTNITNSSEDIVLLSEFTIEIDQFTSSFAICIPYDSVEQIKDKLITPPIVQQASHNNNEWRSSLATGVKHSTVELVANFTDVETTINKLLALQIDDILTINKPDIIDVTVGDVPVLTAQFGKSDKNFAIQVEELINSTIHELKEEALNG